VLAEALCDVRVHEVSADVASHAPIEETEAIAARLAGVPVDAIVVIGGGSVSDTAKAVAILLTEAGRLEDYCSVFSPPDQLEQPDAPSRKPPLLVVPTTLSGAEVTPGGGATNAAGIKRTFWNPRLAAKVIAFDPDVLRAVPTMVLATTGMNGLAHCAEGLYSRTANPISSAFAVAGASHLASGLRALVAGDLTDGTQEHLAAGAALGGLVISSARVGLHHAICHALGARLGLAHGVANSIMLPHVLRFNRGQTERAQSVLASALGASGRDASEAVGQLEAEIGVPRRLRDVDVSKSSLSDVARDAMQDRGLYFNPRRVQSVDDLRALLMEAW
jgi:alcohol dehydrogenase